MKSQHFSALWIRLRFVPQLASACSFVLLSSCVYQITPYSEYEQPAEALATPANTGDGRNRLPDPRYRAPMGIEELERVASMVARASGSKVRGNIELGPDPGPICRIRGSADEGTVLVHPLAAVQVPPNSWAFIFGHEFAHQLGNFGPHGSTTPDLELQADLVGAGYARKAGFDLAAHLGWMFSHRNTYSESHGELHGRAEATARHFGISSEEIALQMDRYGRRNW